MCFRWFGSEVIAGRARFDGGYHSGYDHIPAEITNTYQHQAKIWHKLGLDVGKDRLECGITWHMRQGGINVDTERMETNLPGLYVAGGLGCHYLGGIPAVSFDGKVAGEAAADAAAAPANSATVLARFATSSTAMAKTVQRTPNRSRIRSDSPWPVTTPSRRDHERADHEDRRRLGHGAAEPAHPEEIVGGDGVDHRVVEAGRSAERPRNERPFADRERRVGDEQVGVDLLLRAEAGAARAGAVRRVEGEDPRLQLGQRDAVLGAREVLAEQAEHLMDGFGGEFGAGQSLAGRVALVCAAGDS